MYPIRQSSRTRSTPRLAEIQWSYRPFRSPDLAQWLENSLEHFRVHSITAFLHRCFPTWKMKPRIIGDDMFFLILSGEGTAEIEGTKFPLRSGTCVNFQRGALHSAWHNPRKPLSIISLHYTATIFESLTLPAAMGFPPVMDLKSDHIVKNHFQEACRIFVTRPTAWEAGLNATVKHILFHILWKYGENMRPQVNGARAKDLQRLLPALTHMRSHLQESPPMKQIAEKSGLSEVQFRRIFLRALGLTPAKYFRNLRMERACNLLRATDLTLDAVAESIGYAEASFFANTFKQQFGVSPGVFRRRSLT